jgi:hypothetical protein
MAEVQGHTYDSNLQRNLQDEVNIGIRDLSLQIARLCQCVGGAGNTGNPIDVKSQPVDLLNTGFKDVGNIVIVVPVDIVALIVRNDDPVVGKFVLVNNFPVLSGEVYAVDAVGYNRYFPKNTITIDGSSCNKFSVQWVSI